MTCLAPDLSQPTCRICLKSNEDDMASIFRFDSNGSDLQIYQKIEECCGIKIIRHYQIPSLICRNCYCFLTLSYKFRSICRNSNDYFQEFVVSLSKLEDIKSEVIQEDSQTESCDNTVEEIYKDIVYRRPSSERASSPIPPAALPHKTLQQESSSSVVQSKQHHNEYYEEMWLDGENTIVNRENSNKLQIISVEHVKVFKDVEERDEVTNSPKKESENRPSKTLGISSDGAAVIRVKKTIGKGKKSKEKQPHICDICGNIYDRRYTLEAHMRRHRKEKPFECEICGQAFHCNFELTRHIRKHTGSRPYHCNYCKRSFGDRSTLMKHERIHRNERPYKCETCGKTFTYSSVLKSHQLTHTGEKPYNCELCGRQFSRSHHLRAHLETLQHQNDPLSKVLLKQIKRVGGESEQVPS